MVFFLENTDIRALHPSHIHKTCFQESKMKAGRFGEETPIWDQIQFLDHHIKEKRRLYLLPYYFMMVSVCAPGHYPWGEKKATVPCISSVQLLSRVQLFATPWTAAGQASLSITNSQSSLRLTSIGSYYFQRKWVNLGFDWFFLTITDSEIALTRLVPLLHYLHDFG